MRLTLVFPSYARAQKRSHKTVDHAALAATLRNKTIAAAGLYVFEGKPNVHPVLLGVPNVVLTPHIASVPTRLAMANLAADNLIGYLLHNMPLTPLNPAVLPPA